MTEIARVVIVEDDDTLREHLFEAVSSQPDLECVGTFADGEKGVDGAARLQPDVVLMDIKLPDCSGVECVPRIIASRSDVEIIMYTAFDNSNDIVTALASGAVGYVLKRHGTREIIEAIRDARAGGAPMSSSIARRVIRSMQAEAPTDSVPALTERESQVLQLVARGLQDKEIGKELGISPGTVRVHLRNVYEKWQVSNRAEATATYLRHHREA